MRPATTLFLALALVGLALEHLGLATDVVRDAFSILFGGVVLALALAFGLGGRGVAAETSALVSPATAILGFKQENVDGIWLIGSEASNPEQKRTS